MNNKRSIKKLLTNLLICTAILFQSCDSSHKKKQPSKTTVPEAIHEKSKDTIYISCEEYPPYMSSKMQHKGFFAQVISEAFQLEKIQTKFEFLPAIRSFESAKAGQYDATVPWAKRDERLKDFYYGEALIESDREVFFFMEGNEFDWNPETQDYSTIKGKVIGAIKGANYGKAFMEAEKEGIVKVERVTHTYQNFRKLAAKRIDLMISPEKIALHTLKIEVESNELLKKIKLIQAIKEEVEYDYMIISRKSPNGVFFHEAFNRGMKKLKSSGRYKELYEIFIKSLKPYKNNSFKKLQK